MSIKLTLIRIMRILDINIGFLRFVFYMVICSCMINNVYSQSQIINSKNRVEDVYIQIMDNDYKTFSTQELLRMILDYPHNESVFAHNKMVKGFGLIMESFVAYNEFLKRNDISINILDYIKSQPNNLSAESEKNILYIVLLLSQPEILSNTNPDFYDKIINIMNPIIHDLKHTSIFVLDVYDKLKVKFNKDMESLMPGKSISPNGSTPNVFTPNGTAVNVVDCNPAMTSEEWNIVMNSFFKTYPNISFDDILDYSIDINLYNCHFYAWHMSERAPIESWNTTTKYGMDGSEIHNYWDDNSYIEVDNVFKAEKVTYSGDHSAAITTDDQYYESKLSYWPLIRHSPNNVPIGFGSPDKYYAKATRHLSDMSFSDELIDKKYASYYDFIISGNIEIKNGAKIKIVSGESITISTDNDEVFSVAKDSDLTLETW